MKMASNSRSSCVEGDVGADFGLAELHAHRADHFDFAEAVGGAEFVLGDAVGIESAGQRAVVEDGDAGAVAAQFGGAGERCRARRPCRRLVKCHRARRAGRAPTPLAFSMA